MLKETTVTNTGKDELYCDWYECDNCHCDTIREEANFCPGCGLKINKGIIWQVNRSETIV